MADRSSRAALSRWWRYARFWGPNVDADIDDELRYHLDMRAREYITAGMSPEDAREASRERFGDPHEIARELRDHDLATLRRERSARMLQDVTQDIRLGFRRLRAEPRFTAAAILVLALGIGANAAIFSAIDAAMIRPLPFAAPDRLVGLYADVPYDLGNETPRPKGGPDLLDYRADTAAFSSVAVYATGGLNLAGGAEPIRASVTYTTDEFFETLGRHVLLGRTPAANEYAAGARKVAVLSHAIWRSHFGGDSSVIGKEVTLNDLPYVVIGVMPPDFRFPAGSDAWITLGIPIGSEVFEGFRNALNSRAVARLAPGITVATAAHHADAIRRRYKPTLDADDDPVGELVRPLQSSLIGNRKTPLLVLMGSASLLLLIACANVTNLVLARSAARQREIAVRAALGATRGRIVRQLVVEQSMLALGGAAVAGLVARLSLSALSIVLPPAIAGIAPPALDIRVLSFTAVIALATGLFVGILPALGATRLDLADYIKAGTATAGGGNRRGRARAVLVVVEVSLASMLVVGAGLMIESLRVLMKTDVGLDASNVATARFVLPRTRYLDRAAKSAFYDDVLARLRNMPGVQSAGGVNALPLDPAGVISIRVTPLDGARDESRVSFAAMLKVTPGYFKALGVPVMGEDIPAFSDTTRPVAIVNRTLAEKFWPGESPIGKQFGWANMRMTVIGVVGDIRTRSLDREAQPQMYSPMSEGPQFYGAFVVRGSLGIPTLLGYIREAVRAVAPKQPLYEMRAMEDVVQRSVSSRRANTVLLTTFGAVAIVLAAVGVYAVLSYAVAQRARELGVRMALGARRADILSLVVREGLLLAAIGIVIGLAGAYALSRFLESMLYQVNPRDLRIFATAPVVLAVVAVAATLAPALRATRVDPMSALRME